MKLMFCQECGDILAPFADANKPRWCCCGRHAVWWIDPRTGAIRLHDKKYPVSEGWKYPARPRAYILGITNSFLNCPLECIGATEIAEIIDSHNDYYLFKRWRSCIVRIRPGEADLTAWADLPE